MSFADLLLDSLRDLVLVLDDQGRITSLNGEALRVLQTAPGQFTGQFPSSLPAPWNELCAGCLAGPSPSGEHQILVQGEPRWFKWSRLENRDGHGRLQGTVCLFRDTTEARLAEQALRDKETERQRLLDQLRVLQQEQAEWRQLRHQTQSWAREVQSEQNLVRQQRMLLRNLHDGVGGITSNISVVANLAQMEATLEAKDRHLLGIEQMALEANAEIRRLMNALEQKEFHWSDWLCDVRQSIQSACAAREIQFDLQVAGEPSACGLDLVFGLSLFRLVREAVAHLIKHAAASQVSLVIQFSAAALDIAVHHNGQGLADSAGSKQMLDRLLRYWQELGVGGEMRPPSADHPPLSFRIPLPQQHPDMPAEAPAQVAYRL